MADDQKRANEESWPAVKYAYEMVGPLYEMTERRYVAAEARILQLVAFSITIMLAFIAVVGALEGQLTLSAPFFLSSSFLVIQVIIGLLSTAYGSIATLNLKHIVENTLDYTEWEFKKNVLYWATDDIAANTRLVNLKGWAVWSMTVLLLAEVGCLAWWLFTQVNSTPAHLPLISLGL